MKSCLLQSNQYKQRSQRGVALVIALMITTIAISLASVAMYRQQIQIRLTGNIGSLEQAYQYAVGMEDWSKKILEQDYKDNPKTDHAKEDWATELPPIPVEGGVLIGRLWDLQGKLNLNSVDMVYPKLAAPKPKPNQPKPKIIKTEPLVYERITKLFAKIDKDQVLGPPENFTDTLWDWIDKKDEERQGGAESGYYQSLEKPYMAANAPLMDISELRLLKGMTKELLEDLRPLVSTLPKETRVNLNTAEPEVLEAIGFSTEAAQAIKKAKEETPFESMDDFWSLPEVTALFADGSEMGKKKANYAQTLTVTSNYFLLEGAVKINNTRIFINSILERKKGKVRVISRDFGNPYKSQQKVDDTKRSEPN
ncbi:MAG: type II secretion system minor pseudopilin GspK [Cocleimonas sp.]|nr:type II secretion system minor pseudopilin GspK [Cocleimonas sp.]